MHIPEAIYKDKSFAHQFHINFPMCPRQVLHTTNMRHLIKNFIVALVFYQQFVEIQSKTKCVGESGEYVDW